VILFTLPSCLPSQTATGAEKGKQTSPVDGGVDVPDSGGRVQLHLPLQLPVKSFSRFSDGSGSLEIKGHWVLKESEPPVGRNPYAGPRLNAAIIRCWRSKQVCDELRANLVFGNLLLPAEPIQYEIASWNLDKIIAIWDVDLDLDIQILLHIDADSERAEMEYRHEPTPGRSRLYERWVLE